MHFPSDRGAEKKPKEAGRIVGSGLLFSLAAGAALEVMNSAGALSVYHACSERSVFSH